jgi:two-component system sensor histidine kinase/response regulator
MTPVVLVVDDDAGARSGLKKLLALEGFTTQEAATGSAALEVIDRRKPDVVLTDLKMPGMDGIELCHQIHRRDPLLPVIVITGHGEVSSAVSGMKAGAIDYLVKPLDADAVFLSIRRALDMRAGQLEQQQLRYDAEATARDAAAATRAHEEILAIVSHDLRDPLNVIKTGAQLLMQQVHDASWGDNSRVEVGAIAQYLDRAATRMARLVADLLDESRLRSGQLDLDRTTVRVDDVMAEIMALRPLALRKEVTLVVEAPAVQWSIYGDRLRVAQVFINLVSNAIKFTQAKGKVVVTASDAGREIRFSIRDDGVGIAPEDLPFVFDRYWHSKKNPRASVGLGLHIAKGIIEAHGGHIEVDSQLGHGSTFTVYLPKVKDVNDRISGSWKLA